MKIGNILLSIFFFITAHFTASAQAQLGERIFSTARSLSISDDGNRIAVGWLEFTGCGWLEPIPHVDIYEWSGTVEGWQKMGDSPRFLAVNGEYPTVDAVLSGDGKRVAINTTIEHDITTYPQGVRIFEWTGDRWEQMGEDFDNQGTELALSYDGTRLVVGFPRRYYLSSGFVRTYDWNGTEWEETGEEIEGYQEAENLGYLSMSDDGNRLSVTSAFLNTSAVDGFTRIYEWGGTQWEELGDGTVIEPSENFMLSGNGDHGLNFTPGQSERYDWNGANWEPSAVLAEENATISDDGNRLAVDDAVVYEWTGSDWTELFPAIFDQHPYPGYVPDLAISGNGQRLLTSGVRAYDLALNGIIYELPTLCSNGAARTFRNFVYPTGGTFSGTGLTAGSEADSIVFDPTAAGTGIHEISYSINGELYTATVTVVDPTPLTFALGDTLVVTETGSVIIPGTALPVGGVYSDEEGYVTDDGNGLTFTFFSQETATNINLTYTSPDDNGCPSSATQALTIIKQSPNGGDPYPGQLGMDVRSDTLGSSFGSAVSLSANGRIMAVGAHNKAFGGVHVYNWTGGGWEQMGETISDEDLPDQMGYAIALSADGNRLLVGTPMDYTYDECGTYIAGKAHMYEWDGVGWNLLYPSFGIGFGTGVLFGITLDISGDGSRCVVGTPSQNNNYQGRVNLYQDTEGGLTVDQTLVDDNFIGRFGQAVALAASGNRFVVGEPNEGEGKIHVYDWGSDVPFTIEGENMGDQFGYSVAISDDGNRIVVGAPRVGNENEPGYARIYNLEGGNWMPYGAVVTGDLPGDQFGASVTFSGDGSRIVIGVPNSNHAGACTGRAALYEWDGTNWLELENALPGGDQVGDKYGTALAAAAGSNWIAIGAPQDSTLLARGYVRIFGEEDDGFQNTTDAAPILFETIPDLGGGGIPFESPFIGAVDFSVLGIEVFPNPTTGILYLRGGDVQNVQLMDQAGRVLWKKQGPIAMIDLTDLPTGVYYLRVMLINGQIGGRQIVKR